MQSCLFRVDLCRLFSEDLVWTPLCFSSDTTDILQGVDESKFLK